MFYYAISLLAVAGIAALTVSCVSTAPDGTGSIDADGNERSASEMLAVGEMAPDFRVQDDQGNTVELATFRGERNVVLIFYPGNETPGCTAQLCAVRDDWQDFVDRDVQVFGVNPANAQSHRSFSENHNFPFPLLADTEGEVIRKYGTRGTLGVVTRTVYGIDREGRIVYAERGMPDNERILAAFSEG